MEPIKISLCPLCTECPEVEITVLPKTRCSVPATYSERC